MWHKPWGQPQWHTFPRYTFAWLPTCLKVQNVLCPDLSSYQNIPTTPSDKCKMAPGLLLGLWLKISLIYLHLIYKLQAWKYRDEVAPGIHLPWLSSLIMGCALVVPVLKHEEWMWVNGAVL